jgi:selenium metabolism protein YedF
MKIVDARGQLCPKPLIMLKKAIDELAISDEATIIIDNNTSKDNVVRYLEDNKIFFNHKSESGIHSIVFSKHETEALSDPAQYCKVDQKNITVVISSNVMGRGDDKLGAILIQSFINSLTEFPLVKTLVFYNLGVLLTTDDSVVIKTLRSLNEKGIKILVCGTCADFFGIKEKISCGQISNMYTILEHLTNADKVITP